MRNPSFGPSYFYLPVNDQLAASDIDIVSASLGEICSGETGAVETGIYFEACVAETGEGVLVHGRSDAGSEVARKSELDGEGKTL